MINIDLTGKTALVTGGSQGLGKAICRKLSEAGADLIINYFDDDKGLNKKLAEDTVRSLSTNAISIAANVRDPLQVKNMISKSIAAMAGLDIIINNAGIVQDRTLSKMEYEQWHNVIDTNLTGVFTVCKEASPYLNDNGRIINISSISAFIGLYGQSNYAAAKAGLIGLTKVLCKELAKRKITVNAIAPGVVKSEMSGTIPEEYITEMCRQIPLKRIGEPEEIAELVLFLSSNLSNYITGQTIHINGGWI
ncbi:MAG: 3-oxoacyl-ACP reductase FabG [Spirochaetes bacterium]|nr:3-oxoacyl-ACP reductase FabG [Spirochaetota bacterium]MBL7005917.1 3-oxoacyl-ACP reductase FabG [Spirochaetia bacterium]